MKESLDEIWQYYFLEKCSAIDTRKERIALKKAAVLREKANSLLNNEQKGAIDKYVDAVYEAQGLFTKKAFFKGCEFAASFLSETVYSKK